MLIVESSGGGDGHDSGHPLFLEQRLAELLAFGVVSDQAGERDATGGARPATSDAATCPAPPGVRALPRDRLT